MKHTNACKRIISTLLLLCMLLSCIEYTAFAAPIMRDGEVVKQGALVTSEDGMVTVRETAAHTSGNNFNVTMTVTTSDLVEIEPVRPAHIVLCIDRSNSMDGERRTNTKAAVEEFVSGVLNETGIAAGNQIAVVGFGTGYWNHCGLTSDVSKVKSAVSAATTAVRNVNDGGTNVQAGIYAAQQVFASDNSTAQKVIVLFSDGMPTYSYRLTGTADWTGCSGYGRRHNWNEYSGKISNVTTHFDHDTIVGSGSDYDYTLDSHYASLRVTCEHGWSTTMTNSIYTNNGQPAIAQAQTAKDAGIEIYTVFLDGYNRNEQTSKKNAQGTMKAVATNEEHYMATQDMSELSSLFQSIGTSLVTPTNAGTVAAPMGGHIQLGDVSGLESAGITRTATGLTWNVTSVTPSVDAETGRRTYSVTYPITLQVEAPGFVEAKAYAVNPTTTLTYFVGGMENQVSFDIPTIRGYLPDVPYSIRYYLQGTAEAGDYANYTLADTDAGFTGKLHSKVVYPAGYETRYADYAFAYSSTGPEMTLTATGSNVMCLYYDSTYVPPVEVNYTVRHEYYTNGEKDGETIVQSTAAEGTVLTAGSMALIPIYNEETYEFIDCTPSELTLQVDGSNTVIVRYDRTVIIPPADVSYIVRHEYYTNDILDGAVTIDRTVPEGTEILASDLEPVCTYNDNEYQFTGATPTSLTAAEGSAFTLRYDRTVIIPPAEVNYTVKHEYYTNGEKDEEITALSSGAEGTVLTADSVPRVPVYNEETYEFTGCIPSELTLRVDGDNAITVRYDRTVIIPPAEVNYTVKHEYYTNGERDGETIVQSIATENTVLTADNMTLIPVYNEETYEFTGCTPSELTLQVDSSNTITVRYDRTVVIPPVQVNYTVRHEYYTNGVKDGSVSTDLAGDEGTVLGPDTLSKKPTYNGKTYTFAFCGPETLILTVGKENVIVLCYERTVPSVNYTVKHEYYTNGTKDGETTTQESALEGTEISDVTRCPTYKGKTYTFASCTPDTLTLTAGKENIIVLRYERTVLSVNYTVKHEYYTNGSKDGETTTQESALEGTEISDITHCTTYNGKTYTFASCTPETLTLTAGAENTIVLRYERTEEPPVSTKYTVIHQYYTGDKLDGQTQETLDADIGAIIEASGISKNTAFANGTYTFTSANYEILVVSENGENKLILRYNRPADNEKPAPTPSRTWHHDPTPDSPAARSPQTGDDSATWTYVLSGAGLSLLLLIVVPALPRQNSGGNYKGSKKKK